MKHSFALLFYCILFSWNAISQENTEIYITDISTENNRLVFSRPLNISNNDGYDNQPSFYDDEHILFSSTRNNQIDITQYDLKTNAVKWLTNTPGSSEYSPIKITKKEAFSSIRLDTTGLQRLYSYKLKGDASKVLVKGAKIGYHLWYSKYILVTTVLVDNRMDLVISNVKDKTNYTFQKNVGRSLHNIPNSDMVSYISQEENQLQVKAIHPISGKTKTITALPKGTIDICWLPDGTIITGLENALLKFDPKTDKNWQEIYRFTDENINKISRLAISPNGKKLALVAEIAPEVIINKQVNSFNSRDLDTFASCFSENVIVSNYPQDSLYSGRETLKKNYSAFYDRTPNVNVEVMRRIKLQNTVIDQEQVFIGTKEKVQAAIYQTSNGLIKSMTFVNTEGGDATASEKIVQEQLDAYNKRDIEAFLNTYTEDVEVHNYMGAMRFKGLAKIKEGYANFFASTPDLHCELKNRIVIGNKVIDQESVTANGANFGAIAIYEVTDGKISKVTFIQ